MIQIYKAENTDYEKNGDMTLFPREAYVHPVLNGAWEAYLEHPIDTEGRWEYLTEDAVVKMPSFNGKQLFRIKNVKKSDSGIECDMDPIFFDAAGDCFLEDVRPTGKTGQEALDIMTASNKKYKGKSDITTGSTAYYEYKNLLEAISGDDDNSFLNRWGGEVLYDNYTVTVNERVGGDYGVSLLYGKNIQLDGFTQQIDTTNIITRIYPKAYDGYKMSGKGYVDSLLIGSYPTIHAVTITFDEIRMRDDTTTEVDDDIILCESQEELDAALKQKCEEQYAAGVDKPEVTIKADTVLLEYTQAYQDLQSLEKISLGDTIHCKHTKLNIVTDARVIELYYDSIRQRNSSVVIGDFKGNYFSRLESKADKIDSVVREDGTVIADKVTGIIDVQNAQLRYQKNAAQRQDVRAMLFEDLDPDSELFGAMCYGTQGFQIADERTDDGRDWKWKTAFTAKGGYADSIILGLLADKTGKNFWNLDTGEFSLSSTAKVGGKTVEEISDSKVQEFVNGVYSIDFESIRKNLKNKIETWYQETDPSAEWTGKEELTWCDINGNPIQDINGNDILLIAETEKMQHDGDLWHDLKNNKDYQYCSGHWMEKAVPDEVYDKIDGKAQTFLDTPVPPYQVGDLYFTGKDVLICTGARETGSYDASEWKKRDNYTDDTAVKNLNKLLNQDEIFRRLTNGGTEQGLFIQDGVLYINFSFGRGGTLKLGGLNNVNGLLEVYDANNELVGSWNNKGVNLKKGVISGPKIELHEMNTILGYYGNIQVMKMSNAGLAINSTDPGLGGKKVGFVMTMEPWQYTGMYIKQATSGSGAGTIIDSGFIGLGYGELKGFNPTDATMGAYGVQISTSKNNAAEAGISVLGGNIMQVSKVTGAGISTTGTKNRIANTEDYSQRLLYCYEMPSPMFGDVGEAVTDETGICVVILDDIFRETIVQTDNYHVFLQKQGAGDLWIEEITESYFIVRGTENLKFSWEIKAKQSGYDSERLELFEHSTPEDEVDYEQEGYDVYREYIESKTRTGGENYENFN